MEMDSVAPQQSARALVLRESFLGFEELGVKLCSHSK